MPYWTLLLLSNSGYYNNNIILNSPACSSTESAIYNSLYVVSMLDRESDATTVPGMTLSQGLVVSGVPNLQATGFDAVDEVVVH